MVINRMKVLVFYFVIRLYGYKFLDLWEIIYVYVYYIFLLLLVLVYIQ